MCFHGLGVTDTRRVLKESCAWSISLCLPETCGKPGTGINPLRGQNNVQGAAHMGCDPGFFTGSVSLNDARPLFESVWGASVPANPGSQPARNDGLCHHRQAETLWAIGYDIALTNANTSVQLSRRCNLSISTLSGTCL